MNNLIETMKQALEALETYAATLADNQCVDYHVCCGVASDLSHDASCVATKSITALRTALEQMEKAEPVYQVWRSTDSCNEFYSWEDCEESEFNQYATQDRRVLYTHPAPAVPGDVFKDAIRYRWLRDDARGLLWIERNWCAHEKDSDFDAAIDKAMLAAAPEVKP